MWYDMVCCPAYGMVWFDLWYGMDGKWNVMWYGMWCCMVCGMVWYGMWYDLVCGMVWYVVWFGLWYCMVWYGMVGMVNHCPVAMSIRLFGLHHTPRVRQATWLTSD